MKIRHLTPSEKGLILILFIVALIATLFYNARANEQKIISEDILFKTKILALDENIIKDEYTFKAVSIYDITEGKKIYGRNDTTMLPTASLLKVMTAIVALENDTTGYTVISSEALKQLGDQGLMEGDLWDTKELVKLMLVTSSNDAASALSSYDESFVKKMNQKAQDLGMHDTSFTNVTGLDTSQVAGGLSSADDINKMVAYFYKNNKDIALATPEPTLEFAPENGTNLAVKNTNIIVSQIPNLLFSKTGLTKLAGGNLTIIFKNKAKHDIVVTILGGTEESRFTDMASIVGIMYN